MTSVGMTSNINSFDRPANFQLTQPKDSISHQAIGSQNNLTDNKVSVKNGNNEVSKDVLLRDLNGAIDSGADVIQIGDKFVSKDEAIKLRDIIAGKALPEKSSGDTFKNPTFSSVVVDSKGITVSYMEKPKSGAELRESFNNSLAGGEKTAKDSFELKIDTTGKSPKSGWQAFSIQVKSLDTNQEFINNFDPTTKRTETPDLQTKKDIIAYAKITHSEGPIIVDDAKFNQKFSETFKPGEPFKISVDDTNNRNTFVEFPNGTTISIDPRLGAEIVTGNPPKMYHVDVGSDAYNDMMKTLHLAPPPADDNKYKQIPAGTMDKTVVISNSDNLVLK